MADVAEVLATYDALVGVALGAGLTYGFSALNRRQQERREDKTRWYQARLAAYTEFYQALSDGWLPVGAKRRTDPKPWNRRLGAWLTVLASRLSGAFLAWSFAGSSLRSVEGGLASLRVRRVYMSAPGNVSS